MTALPAAEVAGPVPLTEAQLGLWYAQRLDTGNPIWNTGQVLHIAGPLDMPAFRQAVATAMAEADALAQRVVEGPDGPAQLYDPGFRPDLEIVDAAPDEAQRRIAADAATPLDLRRDPPARQMLFRTSRDRHLWYQRIHHFAVDGYGTALLTRRILDLYAARVAGRPPETAPFAPFAEVLREDAAYRTGDRRHADRDYWLACFADRPEVAGLAPGAAVSAHRYHRSTVLLEPAVAAALRGMEPATGWPDLLAALSAAYVARHTGRAQTVLGVPFMARLGSVAARIPAMVMNILPLRVAVDEDAPLAAFAAGVARDLVRARRHGRYRSEQLRRDLGLLGAERRLYGPLVNILPFEPPVALPGLDTKLEIRSTGAVDDLTFTFRAVAEGLRLELDGNPELYGAAEVAAHAARLADFIGRALGAGRLADVETMAAQERRAWTEAVNDTAHPVPDTTLTALIEDAMRRSPAAPAVQAGDRVLDYRALDRRTAALAGRLGAGRGDVVAVLLPRSVELVLALVAILRAGAAYLPLDPDHPPARIAAMLEIARPAAIVTDAEGAARLPPGTRTLAVDGEEGDPAGLPVPVPDDPAYVIFTSGSTGAPKGVVVQHRAIVNRLEWMRVHYGIGGDERILQKTPATFDVSVWEFFLPLIAGATLVVAPPGAHRDPAELAGLIRRHGITTCHFVPSMLAAFLAEPAAAGLALRRVFCSGEELPAALRDRFHRTLRAELHNLYGPTEAAVDVTFWEAGPADQSNPVPIGRPVWNTALYVLDDRLRPVPPGVAGHLWIAGRQLAAAYLGRPDLTAERFVPDPFGRPGARMYRTGDLARWRPDGALVFLGRSDHQVKIRGQRIELGEIEAALAAADGIAQAVVIARRDPPDGDPRLVAYLVPRGGAPDPAALRQHLAARLPEAMVPAAFVTLGALPVTANGKLDRAALPAPAAARGTDARPPETPTERRVAALFAEVLDVPAATAEDDFFLLGGHSLLGARLMLRLREAGAPDIRLGALFAHPTVARLAAYLDSLAAPGALPTGREGLGVLVQLGRGEPERPPLFCIHPAGGLAWCYAGIARRLQPQRPVWGVQARGLDPRQALPESLDAMAADYVAEIRRLRPAGPYHLMGWSVGGIVAQAVAALLQADGQRVGLLAMLDSYPADVWRDQEQPDEAAALRALVQIAGFDAASVADRPLDRDLVIGFLRRRQHPLGELPDEALTGIVRVVANSSRLVRAHRHRRYDGPLLHVRAALDHAGLDLSAQQWRPYVGAIRTADVPSLHAYLTGPEATAHVAPLLAAAMAEAE